MFEIVYGKEGTSDYMELASPDKRQGIVTKQFPVIRALLYPWESRLESKPMVFCFTNGTNYKVLSCIKWLAGRAGNYFAQHLFFEDGDELIAAGPAWLIKRRRFYIETLTDWSKRDKDKTEKHDWKPIIRPSNYCIGEKNFDQNIEDKIKDIADKWNRNNEQTSNSKFVLLFDPALHNDEYRLDLLYELYARIDTEKRWRYSFCTFDGKRSQPPPRWDLVFVAADDKQTQDYYTKEKYDFFDL